LYITIEKLITGVNGMRKSRKERRKYLQKLVAESFLKFAPKPITPEEIQEFNAMKKFKGLIREIVDALYHAPGLTTNQKKFDNVPEKSIKKLLEEFEERLRKIQTSV
jgi:phosphoribosyl-ATP pyrophosphohydrolase